MDFKLIIAGTRTFSDPHLMQQALSNYLTKYQLYGRQITVISGTAKGADAMGERFAEANNWQVIRMPAQWNRYGRSAGYKRNEEMAKIADGCICFWDGISPGTHHMIGLAYQYQLMVEVVNYSTTGVHHATG